MHTCSFALVPRGCERQVSKHRYCNTYGWQKIDAEHVLQSCSFCPLFSDIAREDLLMSKSCSCLNTREVHYKCKMAIKRNFHRYFETRCLSGKCNPNSLTWGRKESAREPRNMDLMLEAFLNISIWPHEAQTSAFLFLIDYHNASNVVNHLHQWEWISVCISRSDSRA